MIKKPFYTFHYSQFRLIEVVEGLRYKALVGSFLLFFLTLNSNVASAELVIKEKDPESSIINQYEALKDVEHDTAELHQFVEKLNAQLDEDPTNALAWEILAKIYDQYGYNDYAVYAASEAVDKGYSSPQLQKILLNNSISIAQYQLADGDLAGIDDESFLNEYQSALTKVYGEVYDFNYDESLPKPPKPVVKSQPKRKAPKKVTSRKRKTTKTPKTKRVGRPKVSRKAKKTIPTPIKKPQPKPATSTDPFGILRFN